MMVLYQSLTVSKTVEPHHTWNTKLEAEDDVDNQISSSLDLLPLSASIYTLLGLQTVEVGHKLSNAPTIEFRRQNEQSSCEENLLLLPASRYTPPDPVGGDVARHIDGMLTIKGAQANTEDPHTNNCNETSDISAPVDRPVTQASDTPGSTSHAATEHPVELKNRICAEQVLDATTDESRQTGDEHQSKPIRKRRNFMDRLLDRAGRTNYHSTESDIEFQRRESVGRRLGKGALLRIMRKRC